MTLTVILDATVILNVIFILSAIVILSAAKDLIQKLKVKTSNRK